MDFSCDALRFLGGARQLRDYTIRILAGQPVKHRQVGAKKVFIWWKMSLPQEIERLQVAIGNTSGENEWSTSLQVKIRMAIPSLDRMHHLSSCAYHSA
jgi:hypothetical protein